MSRRSLARTALLLLPVQIVFRSGEALLPLLLALWFGRSAATDVYYFCWAVFAFAGSLIFSAYQDSALVPVLAQLKTSPDGRAQLPKVLGSFFCNTLLIGGALSVVIGLLALAWFNLRYGPAEFAVAAKMVPAFCLFLVALSIRTFLSTTLNVDHHYFAVPVASAIGIGTTLAVIGLERRALGVAAIPVGSLAGELVACAVLMGIAIRIAGLRLQLTLERPPPVRKAAALIAYEVGGGAVTRINPVIDQLMAALAGVVGGGTLLRYSGDVAGVPTSLVQAALLPVLVSHLSADYAAGRIARIRETAIRSAAIVFVVLLGACAVLYVVRGPLLRFVFLHGQMDGPGVERMIALLPYHLVGIAPFGVLLVIVRAHVALQNSRIMLGMGLANAALNIVFNVMLVRVLGLEGIALSTSFVHIVIAIVFLVRFRSVTLIAAEAVG